MAFVWMDLASLPMFVVSEDSRGFLVRRWEIEPGGELRPEGDARRAPTLDAARAFVPDRCVRMGRLPDDEPGVIEVWF